MILDFFQPAHDPGAIKAVSESVGQACITGPVTGGIGNIPVNLARPRTIHLGSLDERRQAHHYVRQLLSKIVPSHAAKLEVAFGEALANACRSSGVVTVRLSLAGRWIVIRVKDGGRGFAGNDRLDGFRNGADDYFAEHAHAEGGRGLPIMAAWLDKVKYNRAGNEIMLAKRL